MKTLTKENKDAFFDDLEDDETFLYADNFSYREVESLATENDVEIESAGDHKARVVKPKKRSSSSSFIPPIIGGFGSFSSIGTFSGGGGFGGGSFGGGGAKF